MRFGVIVFVAAAIAGWARPASAQWIPSFSPATAAIGGDPVFPGVGVTTVAPTSAPSVPAAVPGVPVQPAALPLALGETARLLPPIPDSTFVWLTYYGSPLSPYFIRRPLPPYLPAPWSPGSK